MLPSTHSHTSNYGRFTQSRSVASNTMAHASATVARGMPVYVAPVPHDDEVRVFICTTAHVHVKATDTIILHTLYVKRDYLSRPRLLPRLRQRARRTFPRVMRFYKIA